MLRLFTYILGFTIAINPSFAEEIPFNIQDFAENIASINSITLQFYQDNGEENIYWRLNLPQREILAEKLLTADKFASLDTTNFLPNKDKKYLGVVIQARNNNGDTYSNLRVFNGRVTDNDDNVLFNDLNRDLEFWLLGTAQTIKQRYVIASAINIASFEQCKMLGNDILFTKPRQCLLATGDILMEVKGSLSEEALAVNSFDECLQKGKKLIKSFPRKCVAAGGRVFLEPRRKNTGRKLKEYIWK